MGLLMNPQVSPDDLKGKTAKEAFLIWAFNQGTSTVLLVGILISIGYSAFWLVNVGVPKHIQQLNEASSKVSKENNEVHERLNSENNRIHQEQAAKFESSLKHIIDSHDKEIQSRDKDAANKDKQIMQLWDMIFNIRQKPEKAALPVIP